MRIRFLLPMLHSTLRLSFSLHAPLSSMLSNIMVRSCTGSRMQWVQCFRHVLGLCFILQRWCNAYAPFIIATLFHLKVVRLTIAHLVDFG